MTPQAIALDAPFQIGQLVETKKGAKFWGEVVSCYTVTKFADLHQTVETDTWRCDVRAIDPGFAGTIHVYPAAQLVARVPDAGAEPVAWRYRFPNDRAGSFLYTARWPIGDMKVDVEPLYANPPALAAEVERLTRERDAEHLMLLYEAGKHSEWLDKYEALKAEVERLRKALGELVSLFPREGENSVERFERIAENFYHATGMMRPGKDDARGADTLEERQAAFDKWYNGFAVAARSLLREGEAAK